MGNTSRNISLIAAAIVCVGALAGAAVLHFQGKNAAGGALVSDIPNASSGVTSHTGYDAPAHAAFVPVLEPGTISYASDSRSPDVPDRTPDVAADENQDFSWKGTLARVMSPSSQEPTPGAPAADPSLQGNADLQTDDLLAPSPEDRALVASFKAAHPDNPNATNLDKFLAAIDRVSAEQNIPSNIIAMGKEQVIKDVATTTDLHAKFLEIVSKSAVSKRLPSPVLDIVKEVVGSVIDTFSPKRALAFGLHFGTPNAFYQYYCSCSGNWLITMMPIAPNYVTLLLYMQGTEIYQGYNLPFSREILGEYQQGGQCQVIVGTGCVTLPSQGNVMSEVGSAQI